MSDFESAMFDLVSYALDRFLRAYKAKPRRGSELDRLKLVEQAKNCIDAARLK
jgi:hypothetical protein